MAADTGGFRAQVAADPRGRVAADPETLQTRHAVGLRRRRRGHGPSDITRAVGQGRRAAHMIDRWICGPAARRASTLRLPVVDKAEVLARQKTLPRGGRRRPSEVLSAAPERLPEVELPMTEAEARRGAGRCLDCGVCSECHECVDACPAESCIDLRARDQMLDVDVGAVVVATGFKLFPADLKPQYGYGTFKNVITGMQMDRLLAPTRPYNTSSAPATARCPSASPT